MSKVLIERAGPLVCISPWIPSLVSVLSYEYRKMSPTGGKTIFETHQLYILDESNNRAFTPASTTKAVMKHLTDAGFTPEYIETRDVERLFPEPDWSVLDQLRPGQQEVLEAVVNNDCGLIVSSTGFGKSFCITQLCKIYPKLNFIIVAPGIAEARNLYDGLRNTVNKRQVGMLGGGKEELGRRITVSTVQSVLKADFQKCDIFIFDEAHTMGHNKTTFELLQAMQDSRVYGFTATPSGRSDNSDKVIWGFFGDILVDFSYKDNEERGNVVPIDVFIYDINSDPIESSKSKFGNTFVQNKRRWYWRNDYRNVAIATVARSIPEDQQILIMVESVDHLIELGQYLPEFALVCAIGNDLPDRAKKRRINLKNRLCHEKDENAKIYQEFKEGKTKRVISSMTWKQGVSFDGLNVLIRADGATSPILSTQIPGRLSRISPGKDRAVLVDFRDMFNDTAKGYYYKRIGNYKKNGWAILMKGDPLE